jgi:hypothetical protein
MGGSSTRLAIRSVEPQIQFDNNATLKVTLIAEGVNFPAGHDVRLNEQSVEITSIDMTGNLAILIPAGLPGGLYDITLVSPDGQTATLSQAFRVEESELTIFRP